MIFTCPHCSLKVGPTEEFCPACRRLMVRRCGHCNERVASTAPVCKYCGEDAAPPAAAPSEATQVRLHPQRANRAMGRRMAAVFLAIALGIGACGSYRVGFGHGFKAAFAWCGCLHPSVYMDRDGACARIARENRLRHERLETAWKLVAWALVALEIVPLAMLLASRRRRWAAPPVRVRDRAGR